MFGQCLGRGDDELMLDGKNAPQDLDNMHKNHLCKLLLWIDMEKRDPILLLLYCAIISI